MHYTDNARPNKVILPLSPRSLSLALWVLTGACVVVSGLLVVRLMAWRAPVGPVPAFQVLTGPQDTDQSTQTPPLTSYQAVAENPVFGPPAQQAGAESFRVLPVSVCVIGTIVQGTKALAIVETDSSGQKLMRVGDVLEGGRIVQITRGEIVLSKSGEDIVVPVAPSRRRARAGERPAPVPARRTIAVTRPQVGQEPEPVAEEELVDVDLEEFDSFVDDFKKNAEAVTAHTAHDVAGEPIGLLLEKVPEGSKLRRIGLLPGDVVTEVNTFPVTSLAELLSTFDRAADEVKREEGCFIVIEMVREQKHDAVILTIW